MRNPLRTISAKIVLICLISCTILVLLVLLIVLKAMYELDVNSVKERLNSDMAYFEKSFGEKDASWFVRDGMLYYGKTPIGNGKISDANSAAFKEFESRTHSFAFAAVRKIGLNAEKSARFKIVVGSDDEKNAHWIGRDVSSRLSKKIENSDTYSGAEVIGDAYVYSMYRSIYNEQHQKVGFVAVGRDLDELKEHAESAGLKLLIILLVLMILGGIGISYVAHIYEHRALVIKKYLAELIDGKYPEKALKLGAGDELDVVADCINEMIGGLKKNDRLRAELNLASVIQSSMLPSSFPPFPDNHEFDIYATMTPAKEVGGDFYDFFMLDDKRIVVVIGDVSGKGIPASLVMVITRTLIKNHMLFGMEPAEVFSTVNQMGAEEIENSMFVTAWMGVLDLETGILTYVNAGHNPPLMMHDSGLFEFLHSPAGFVLGGMEGIRYKQYQFEMNPGDRLFLYTDGVTEATDAHDNLYGEDRLRNYLNQHASYKLEDILVSLKQDIDAFAGDVEQFDDITMLMLDFRKKFEQVK